MSIQAVGWVLEHSKARGAARLVLIALANHVNAQTGQCNPGYRRIALEAGVSPGSVSTAVRELVELGEIEIAAAGSSHKSARYRLPWLSTADPHFVQSLNKVAKSTREVRAVSRAKRASSSRESIKTLNQEARAKKETAAKALEESRRALSPRGRPR